MHLYANLSTPQLSQTLPCLVGIIYAHAGHLKVKYCTHSQKSFWVQSPVICMWVCKRARACVCAWERECVCVCARACVRARARMRHVCANLPVHKTKLSPIANTQQSRNVKNYQDPSHDTHRSLLPNIILMIKTLKYIMYCFSIQYM